MLSVHRISFAAAVVAGMAAVSASASPVLVDFNTSGELGNNFDFSANFTEQTSGGVDDTGSVRPSDADGTAVYNQDTFTLGVGEVASMSMFISKVAATADTSRMLQLGLGTAASNTFTTAAAPFLSARVDTVVAGAGTFQLVMQQRPEGNAPLQSVAQGDPFTLDGERLYKFSVHIERTDNDTYTIAGSLDDYGPDGLAFSSTLISFEPVTVTNGAMDGVDLYAAFRSGYNAGAHRLDDFSVEIVPEPASLSLLTVGGGLMLLRRRNVAGH